MRKLMCKLIGKAMWWIAAILGLDCYADSMAATDYDGWLSDSLTVLLIVGMSLGWVLLFFGLCVWEVCTKGISVLVGY